MVVLLKFRFGEISLIPKWYGFFYLRKCTFFAIDPGKREGAMIWTVFFFHRVEKNTVPKPKILLTPQKSQMEAIFVKNQNWNSFQVFERFFFLTQAKKMPLNRTHEGREENSFVPLENETFTPFSIPPENLVFFMEPCIACLLVRFLSLLKLHQICSSNRYQSLDFLFF